MMRTTPAPRSWHQAWSWLCIYAALSLADHGLTQYALTTGRLGWTPGAPYTAAPWAMWLLVQQGTVSVQAYKGLAVIVGALLLICVCPVWSHPWVRRVTIGVLGAGIAWEVLSLIGVIYVLLGG